MWLVVVASCASAATMFMAITNVLATVPEIAVDIEATQSELQWVADCYPLVLASLLLPAGVLADRFGRKTFLIAGLTLLCGGLVVTSSAGSATGLIAGLCLAGAGSGLSFPSTLATITGTVAPERRPMAVSLWAAAVPIGGLSGALFSGAIVQWATWPTVFLVTAAFALACLVLSAVVVPETRDPEHSHLDLPGAVLSAAAVASLVVGITHGPVEGWGSVSTIGWLIAATVLMCAFVAWELRVEHPLLDVRLFAIPAFGAAVAAMFVMFAGLFAVVFLAYQWEAYVLGWHSLKAAFGLVPFAIFMLPLALTGTTLARRVGMKPVIAAALAIGAIGSVLLALAGETGEYWTLALGCTVFGACIGLSAGPGTEAISGALPAARQGVGSAVNDLARELGATLGIAISGTAFNIGYRAHVQDHLESSADPVGAAVLASPGAGTRAAAQAGESGASHLDLIASATNAGWTTGALVMAAAFALAFVVFVTRFPAADRAGEPQRTPA